MVNIYHSYYEMGQDNHKGYIKVQDMQGYRIIEEDYYDTEEPYRVEISKLEKIYPDANWCEMKY